MNFSIPHCSLISNFLETVKSKMGSFYRQSIPVLIKYLKNLSGILEKSEKYADKKGMKLEYMLNFRLVHDMQG